MNTMNFSSLTIKEWTEADFNQISNLTAIYCRLSQDDGSAGDSDSIINQKKLLGNFISREKLPNPVYFIDDGFSGTTFNRPAIKKILDLIDEGRVKNVVVKDLSRLGRDYLRVGQLLEMTFPDNNIRFIAVNDNVDSAKESDIESTLLPIRNLFNEFYARDTSKKIRSVMQTKAKSGERLTVIPIYGYKKDPDNPKNWLVDEVASDVVKRIFSEAKSGKSLSRIAKDLEKDRIETPSYRRISLGENPTATSFSKFGWHRDSIALILSRQEYLWHTVNCRTRNKSYKDKRKIHLPENEWLIFKDTHEAIIDQDTFDIVQKMRNHKRILGNPRLEKGHENLFAGLVYCGTCSSKHYFCAHEKDGVNLDHYKCSSYSKRIDRCINPHYIRKENLCKLVLEDINNLLEQIQFDKEKFVKKLEAQHQLDSTRLISRQRQQLLNQENRISEIDRIIQRLYEDNVSGKLSDERFVKLSQNYEVEQAELNAQMLILKDKVDSQDNLQLDLTKFLMRIEKYSHIDQLTTEIINELIDKIIIHKPEGNKRNRILKIEIYYNFIGVI